MRLFITSAIVMMVGLSSLTALAAPKATLYQRLGGEPALRAVLGDFYDRLLADPDLKDRFVGVDMAALKNQVFDFVGQATGGPQRYHGRTMLEAHRGMKITSQEWDRSILYLKQSLNKFHVKSREKAELLAVIGKLRSDIVYQPVAATTPAADASLYDRLGGETALRAVISDFYDRLLLDPITKDRFVGVDMDHLKSQVVDFVGQVIGGPQKYQGADMKTAHTRFRITAAEWDASVQHLVESLDKYRVADKEKQDLLKIVGGLRGDIVRD